MPPSAKWIWPLLLLLLLVVVIVVVILNFGEVFSFLSLVIYPYPPYIDPRCIISPALTAAAAAAAAVGLCEM